MSYEGLDEQEFDIKLEKQVKQTDAAFNMSTYGMFPNEEEPLGSSNAFYENKNMNIFDYLNLVFYGGGAVLFFYYFTENFDSMGYIMFIFGILIFCEIMG
jgi:hypothetical protein